MEATKENSNFDLRVSKVNSTHLFYSNLSLQNCVAGCTNISPVPV